MKKYFGKISIAIALFGTYIVLNAHNRHVRLYENLGELGDLISFPIYSDLEFVFLVLGQFIGIILGSISIKRNIDRKISLAGILICLFNFLFSTEFLIGLF